MATKSVNQNLNFNAQVSAWVRKSEGRMQAVFRESSKRVISLAQSRIPVDTGFARASLQVSLENLPEVTGARPAEGQTYNYDAGIASVTISNAQLGQTVYAGWTANYAIYLEYGHSQQAPSGFVRISAAQWPQIVSQVTREARARAGA